MTETSWYWANNIIGDGSLSPYDNDEFSDNWRKLFQNDRTTMGHIEGFLNELAVSNPAGNTIRVATGGALVDGKFYETDANVDNAIATPAALTRIDRVVLRKSWAAQTVRVAILTGVEGGGVPALTQTEGVTWEIPLAQVSITVAPAITITDERTVNRSPLSTASASGLTHIETLTGDGSSATLDFSGIATTFRHLMLIGQIRLTGAVVDADVNLNFNADGGANYHDQTLNGANATASAVAAVSQALGRLGTFPGATAIANYAGQIEIMIANYKLTTFFKNWISRYSSIPNVTVADFDVGEVGGLWIDASAINQIELLSSSGNFATGTSVSLYGIL